MEKHILLSVKTWTLSVCREYPDTNSFYFLEHQGGFCDYPIFYNDKKLTAFDRPERIPRTVKSLVNHVIKFNETY